MAERSFAFTCDVMRYGSSLQLRPTRRPRGSMKLVVQIAAGVILGYCVLMLLGSLRHWRLRRQERRNVRRLVSELALGLAAVAIVILLVSRLL